VTGRDTLEDVEPSKRTRRSLKPLMGLKPYLMRQPVTLALAAVALVVSALAMLSVPIAVRRVIDVGFTAGNGEFIHNYFLMLILVGLVLAVAGASRFYLVNILGERVVADLRRDVFRHLATLGPAFFEKTHSGEMMSRLTADTTQLKSVAGSTISQAIRNVIMLIGSVALMFVTSPQLSTLVLLAIPVIVLPLIAYGRFVRKLSRKAQDTLAEASAYAAENLAAVRTMQAFSHESVVADRFAGAVERSFGAARERLSARAGLTGIAMFLTVASIVAILWYGASKVIAGEMTGGTLSQFVIYAVLAAGALAELSEVWGEVSQGAGAAERLAELLAVEPEIKSPPNPLPMPQPARGEIVFDAVQFQYPSRPDASALQGISLRVAPGETVALVGPSGAGKTTLFSLLLRFYDPQGGRILVDGVPVNRVDIPALRSRMALVPQDVALFADTVLENIRYGSPGASEEDVVRAAVAAQADGFIRALPEGYATRASVRRSGRRWPACAGAAPSSGWPSARRPCATPT